MKLGQPVVISSYFQKNNKYCKSSEDIPEAAVEIEPNVFEFENYSPVDCNNMQGIITGYKQLSTKIHYQISQHEIFKGSVETSWIREPVYVVQNTLTKKYFVKRDWIQVI